MPTIKFKLKDPKYCISLCKNENGEKKSFRCPCFADNSFFSSGFKCRLLNISISCEDDDNCGKRPQSCIDKYGE